MQRTWISRYDAGVPAKVSYPDWTVPNLLQHSAARDPDSPALFFYGACISYRDLDDLTTRLALALQRLGVKQSDRVALMLPNIPQSVIAYYGILKAGAVAVPTNPLYVEREIQTQVLDSGSGTIIALDLLYPRIRAVQAAAAFPKQVIITSIRDFLPPLKKFLYPLKARLAKRWISTPTGPSVYNLLDLIDSDPLRMGTKFRFTGSPDDLAQLQYTGGTTGIPGDADTKRGRERAPRDEPGLRIFGTGRNRFWERSPSSLLRPSTCQNLAVATGCRLCSFRALIRKWHRQSHKHRITVFSGVPMMFAKINDVPINHCFAFSAYLS